MPKCRPVASSKSAVEHQSSTGDGSGARESNRRWRENRAAEGWGIRTGIPLHNRLRAGANPGVEIGEAYSKGVDLTGLLGGHKRRLEVWGTEVPQKLKLFFVKLHIILAFKYNKQQLLLLSTFLGDLDIVSCAQSSRHPITTSLLKYWGTLPWTVPLHKYWGHVCPPVP